MNYVIYNGIKIEYELTRKNVKNINLRVRRDGAVAVSANSFVPLPKIDEFVFSNAEKILNCIDRLNDQNKCNPKYISNENAVLLGKEYIIRVIQGSVVSYSFNNSFIILCVKNPDDFLQRKASYNMLVRDLAQKIFSQIIRECYPSFINVCKTVPALKIREMKSRWGSCHYNKNEITLNLKLIEYDINVIKFVVMHEYCHFIYPNHSKEFYNALSAVMNDWKKYDSILKNEYL